jgi:hypothetical protein
MRVAILAALCTVLLGCTGTSGLGSAAGDEAHGNGKEALSVHVTLLAPREGVYIAAFPDMGGSEDTVETARIKAFEEAVGRPVAWVYFSNNWYDGITFPSKDIETIHAAGSVPFIRLMARSREARDGGADPKYNMAAILSGTFDADLAAWARAARAVGRPILAEFGTEVNGSWFRWNGQWNGGGTTDGYGDPAVADGPERFRDAFRRIIDICRAEGAHNIVWFFHVDPARSPQEPWNTFAAYYPGDDYIDWIGISCFGSQRVGREWIDFNEKLAPAYVEAAALSPTKPLAIVEYAVVEDPARDKAAWITDAIGAVRAGRYPRIKALSYWNEAWGGRDGQRVDLRANSSPAAVAAYREAIADPFFVTKLEFGVEPAPTPNAPR